MSDMEQREFFRVDDRLPLEYRAVDADEFVRLEDVIRYNPTYKTDRSFEMHFLADILSRTRSDDSDLIAYLKIIEKKLDMIMEMLNEKRADSPYTSLYASVNLSGSGVRFLSPHPLVMGERLELRIALPFAPFPKISTLCEVVRVDGPSAEKKEWQIALRFLVVNEFDRDFLINYVFTKEREKLRSEKKTG